MITIASLPSGTGASACGCVDVVVGFLLPLVLLSKGVADVASDDDAREEVAEEGWPVVIVESVVVVAVVVEASSSRETDADSESK